MQKGRATVDMDATADTLLQLVDTGFAPGSLLAPKLLNQCRSSYNICVYGATR